MPQIMSKPDPTIFQNRRGIDDEAISGEIVDSLLLQSPDSEGWIVVIKKKKKKYECNNQQKNVSYRRHIHCQK